MSKRNITPNNLKPVIRDGIVDVEANPWGITTVEAEFDRAMSAQADYERAHPVEAAVQQLEHDWKHNRHGMTSYGDTLDYYMKQPTWEQVKPLVEAKGLPVTKEAWTLVEQNYTWKVRAKMVREQRVAKAVMVKLPWYPEYLKLAAQDHPVLKGEWKG